MMKKHIFRFSHPQESLGFLLWQITTSWQRRIKKSLEVYKLSHAQFVVMATLACFESQHQVPTQVLIAHWSKLDKMSVSASLKELAQRKFIHRSEHEKDTRAKIVQLTPQGRKLIFKMIPMVEKIDDEFFGNLTVTEQAVIVRLFKKLVGDNTNF